MKVPLKMWYFVELLELFQLQPRIFQKIYNHLNNLNKKLIRKNKL